MSWTIMFNEAAFWEMLLRSSGNVYDYVGHIHNKFADLDGNSRISRPGWELVTLHNFVSPRSFNYTLKQWKKVIPILHTSLVHTSLVPLFFPEAVSVSCQIFKMKLHLWRKRKFWICQSWICQYLSRISIY